jgi:hypothetical protein
MTAQKSTPASVDQITPLILIPRRQRALLDADLAALSGFPTRRPNEQVRRNRARFPDDFLSSQRLQSSQL